MSNGSWHRGTSRPDDRDGYETLRRIIRLTDHDLHPAEVLHASVRSIGITLPV